MQILADSKCIIEASALATTQNYRGFACCHILQPSNECSNQPDSRQLTLHWPDGAGFSDHGLSFLISSTCFCFCPGCCFYCSCKLLSASVAFTPRSCIQCVLAYNVYASKTCIRQGKSFMCSEVLEPSRHTPFASKVNASHSTITGQ